MRHIVYLVHGARKYHLQARYSMLSLLDLLMQVGRDDYRVVIYTDRPDLCVQHDRIQAVPLLPETLRAFRGPLDYVHRVKIKVLARAARELHGPLIYADCDTKWQALPDAAFEQLEALPHVAHEPTGFMHVLEGQVSPAFYGDYWARLSRSADLRQRLRIDTKAEWPMWNAGTVGVPAGAAALFDHALDIVDGLIGSLRRKNWVEQLALSIALDQSCRIQPFDRYLDHYWQYTAELPKILDSFFESFPDGMTVEAQAQAARAFVIDPGQVLLIRKQLRHRLQQMWPRWKRSLAKRRVEWMAIFAALRHKRPA